MQNLWRYPPFLYTLFSSLLLSKEKDRKTQRDKLQDKIFVFYFFFFSFYRNLSISERDIFEAKSFISLDWTAHFVCNIDFVYLIFEGISRLARFFFMSAINQFLIIPSAVRYTFLIEFVIQNFLFFFLFADNKNEKFFSLSIDEIVLSLSENQMFKWKEMKTNRNKRKTHRLIHRKIVKKLKTKIIEKCLWSTKRYYWCRAHNSNFIALVILFCYFSVNFYLFLWK